MLLDLTALATRSEQAIEVRSRHDLQQGQNAPPATRPKLLPPPSMHRSWNATTRITSYSGLTRHAAQHHEPAPDRDEHVREPAQPSRTTTPVPLADFPKGPKIGDLLHCVFEHLDFTSTDPSHLRAAITTAVSQHGPLSLDNQNLLAQTLPSILSTTMGEGKESFRLCDISTQARINEMEFLLPIALQKDSSSTPLDSQRLGDLFSQHASSLVPDGYGPRLSQRWFPPLRGYLKGFIDLIFRHGERWYVADYKSNFLGTHAQDYVPSALIEPMTEHDYFLQYHLYAAALHRMLQHRLVDYEPQRHFGGVFYFFLRGMSPSHEPGCGVFFDRPQKEILDALSEVLQ
jgi:exodeoxyribonuclease V beta subunit